MTILRHTKRSGIRNLATQSSINSESLTSNLLSSGIVARPDLPTKRFHHCFASRGSHQLEPLTQLVFTLPSRRDTQDLAPSNRSVIGSILFSELINFLFYEVSSILCHYLVKWCGSFTLLISSSFSKIHIFPSADFNRSF